MFKKKQRTKGESSDDVDLNGGRMDIRSILKDIEFLGSSHMTWKEKKDLENKKVVSLGGKPPKKQRLPLSVARVTMKKQKEREQKMLEESSILGRYGGMFGSNTKKLVDKRKPEDRVLKSTEGNFRNGMLDVKHLLQPAASINTDSSSFVVHKGRKKKDGKKKSGKKKGSNRRRH